MPVKFNWNIKCETFHCYGFESSKLSALVLPGVWVFLAESSVFHLFIHDLKTKCLQDCQRKSCCYVVGSTLRLLSMHFVLAIKKPLISAPRSDNHHQADVNLPTEQPHAPNLAPGKILTSR